MLIYNINAEDFGEFDAGLIDYPSKISSSFNPLNKLCFSQMKKSPSGKVGKKQLAVGKYKNIWPIVQWFNRPIDLRYFRYLDYTIPRLPSSAVA
jgi:hypothetical protein